VIDAVDLPLGGRRVKVQPVDLANGCPECGVVSARVHAWTEQRVRDIPQACDLEVVLTWLNLVSRGCVLDGIDGGSCVGVEGCSGRCHAAGHHRRVDQAVPRHRCSGHNGGRLRNAEPPVRPRQAGRYRRTDQ
jgi:hypothetical protein